MGEAGPGSPTSMAHATLKKAPETNWGIFESLRGPLGPVAEMVHPSVIVAMLLTIIFLLWWRLSTSSASHTYSLSEAQRVAAYEELWRKEESSLWKWLEDRAGVQEGGSPSFLSQGEERERWMRVKRVRDMSGSLEGEGMEERRMREAIRVTRERLGALEEAVRSSSSGKGKKRG